MQRASLVEIEFYTLILQQFLKIAQGLVQIQYGSVKGIHVVQTYLDQIRGDKHKKIGFGDGSISLR